MKGSTHWLWAEEGCPERRKANAAKAESMIFGGNDLIAIEFGSHYKDI
jgi:hypothetical protein